MSLLLLPTLVLLAAGTAVLLATRAWKRLGSRPGGSRGSRAAPEAPGSPPAEESPRRGPAAPGSPPFIPCGCGPGCGPCVTAARELQDLVTPLWPGVSFPRDSEMWRLSWEDLEQLLERGHLPCCASCGSPGSLHPSRSLGESCQTPRGGEDAVDGCRRSLSRRNRSSLRMHVAKKSLEVKLGAQPAAVRRSQEQQAAPSSESPSGSCQTPDGGDSAHSSPCSHESADVGGARASLRMHVAKKSLEVKLGARPAAVRSSQERLAQREGSRSCRCPRQSSQPCAGTPRSKARRILQRQRELEFPHLQGAPPSRIRLLLAAQIVLRMFCLK